MNTFLTNQLEDVKNDLKEMDIHITCPYCNVKLVAYAEGQRARCKNNKCKGETKDYPLDIMSIIELNTKIKTKLQKYHEWAREERKELCGYIRNPEKNLVGKCILSGLECSDIFRNHKDCSVCLLYFSKNYQIDLTRRE